MMKRDEVVFSLQVTRERRDETEVRLFERSLPLFFSTDLRRNSAITQKLTGHMLVFFCDEAHDTFMPTYHIKYVFSPECRYVASKKVQMTDG